MFIWTFDRQSGSCPNLVRLLWKLFISSRWYMFMNVNLCVWLCIRLVWILTNIIVILQYNTKDSSVRLAYEPQPHPKALASLAKETIVKVACGTNHTGCVYDLRTSSISLLMHSCLCKYGFVLTFNCICLLYVLCVQWQLIQMVMFIRKFSYGDMFLFLLIFSYLVLLLMD